MRDPRRERYLCLECLADVVEADIRPAAAMARARPQAPPDLRADGVLGDAAIPLEPPAPESRETQTRACPICLRRVLAGNPVCGQCGYDERAGLQPSTRLGKRPLGERGLICRGCGYNLRGLRSLRCPECGERVQPLTDREIHERSARQQIRVAYLQPLGMLVVGAGLLALIVAFNSGWRDALTYLLAYAIRVPFGLGMFWLCSWLFIGFDMPMRLAALRLAGIYAVVDLTELLAAFVVGGFLDGIVASLVYFWLLMTIMDLEARDALLLAVVTRLAMVIVAIALFAWIF